MPHLSKARRPVVVRPAVRPRIGARQPQGNAAVIPVSPTTPRPVSRPALDATRRVVESVVVATIVSAGLYLVGSVYTDAYYSRLSIEVTSLDLTPPFVALQSIHALQGLLEYPWTLLVLYVLYRTFASPVRRLRNWFERARRRYPRLVLIIANLVVIAPLVIGAFVISYQHEALVPGSVITEVTNVLQNAALILLIYAIWLGWSQRTSIVAQIQARKLLPIALVFIVYLLNALASTATTATQAAELLMTGSSDSSMGVVFTMKADAEQTVAEKDLILVTARNGAFFVVERQPAPPSQRPTAYVIPAATVKLATVRRLNDANATFSDFILDQAS